SDRCVVARSLTAGGEKRQVHPGEALFAQRRSGDVLAAERQHRASRSRRGIEAQLRERKPPPFENAEQFAADRAGGADDRDNRRRSAQAGGSRRVCRRNGHALSPLLSRETGAPKQMAPSLSRRGLEDGFVAELSAQTPPTPA